MEGSFSGACLITCARVKLSPALITIINITASKTPPKIDKNVLEDMIIGSRSDNCLDRPRFDLKVSSLNTALLFGIQHSTVPCDHLYLHFRIIFAFVFSL